jgi:hypothetical protein
LFPYEFSESSNTHWPHLPKSKTSIGHMNCNLKQGRVDARTFTGSINTLSNPWHYSPLLDLGRFFSFLIVYTDGTTP